MSTGLTSTGNPFAPPPVLRALGRGRASNYPLTVQYSDGTPATGVFTSGNTLTATLISGDDVLPTASPTTSWTNATLGQYMVSFVASDTTGATPGTYILEIIASVSGNPVAIGRFTLPILDTYGTATANPIDLVSMTTVQAALAEVLPTDQSYVSSAITAASLAVQRYLRRCLAQQQFIEILAPQPGEWDKGEADLIQLSQYPIIGTPMLRVGWTNALMIQNTATTTNDEAYVGFTTSGDPQISTTNTGVILTAIANGVQTQNTVSWTTTPPYTTIQSVANSINALGNGWKAVVQQPDLERLGAYQLYGSTAYSPASSPGQTMLSVFQYPVVFASIDTAAGEVWLAPGYAGPGYGTGYGATVGMGDWIWSGGSLSGSSNFRPPVLCNYVAGYASIPQDVQSGTLVIVKALLQELETPTVYDTETAGEVTLKLATLAERMIPTAVKKLLSTYRRHSVR